MSRFNYHVPKNTVLNAAGGVAYQMSDELALYSLVCNSLLHDKAYESGSAQLDRMTTLVRKCDAKFVANLASYARNEMNLRSVSTALTVLLARYHGGSVARKCFMRTVKRVDEITEALAFYAMINNHKCPVNSGNHQVTKNITKRPNSMVRGLADVFSSDRFDEYQFAKYDRAGQFTLKDALFITHPKPKSELQQALFDRIVKDELKTPDTWETAMSDFGKRADVGETDKLAEWQRLIQTGKMGHMALLRNLRNIVELYPSKELVQEIAERLVADAPRGKQLPFRYWAAYRELAEIGPGPAAKLGPRSSVSPFTLNPILSALNKCATLSSASLPKFQGTVLVACDVSGSMFAPISPKSSIQNYDIGLVLGASLHASLGDDVAVGIFGDSFKMLTLPKDPLNAVAEMCRREGEVGYATNGYKVLEHLLRNQLKADNILLFTDAELYNNTHEGNLLEKHWAAYKKMVPEAQLWLFNLAGHGTTPCRITDTDVHMISGWSDKIFEAVERMKNGQSAIEMIREYTK